MATNLRFTFAEIQNAYSNLCAATHLAQKHGALSIRDAHELYVSLSILDEFMLHHKKLDEAKKVVAPTVKVDPPQVEAPKSATTPVQLVEAPVTQQV
jgi:hypothetical protein